MSNLRFKIVFSILLCGLCFIKIEAKAELPTAETREVLLTGKYLLIPVDFQISQSNHEDTLRVHVGDKLLYEYRVMVASEEKDIDWWAFFDMSTYVGKKVLVQLKGKNVSGIDMIKSGNEIPANVPVYKEKLRPQFHFTSKRGWLNDPNGLIFYKGEYHLYYQHNPVSVDWGNMTWGHAVSKDLVHWKELPIVLSPNDKGDCFSGAAFIDRKNQLEQKTGKEDVLVMFYLRTNSGLSLAYSNDRGRTLTDYEGNPVITHAGARIDTPRPFWYEPTGRWIAPTYDHFEDKNGNKLRAVGFYSSENLTDWKFESRVEQNRWGDELCGCADFFQLPVDGDPKNKKWVLVLIDGSYIVGTFDGHKFYTLTGTPAVTDDRNSSLVIQEGNYYATMTWHNVANERRVQITWMRYEGLYTGMPFNQQMTVPVDLTLHSTDEGPRLRMNPIRELEILRTKTHEWKNLTLTPGKNPLSELTGDLFDVEVEFEPAAGAETVFDLRGIKVMYNSETQMLSCGSFKPVKTILKSVDSLIRLRILLDRTSIEVFGNDGRVYLPRVVFPSADNLSLKATCDKGEVNVRFLRVHELQSAWE